MNTVLDKVKHAALCMQRHNWEQGVLAQAFLEAGDAQTALLLAVEGANRQSSEGRCCHIADSTASTDPCAVGEALIRACEQTGDPQLIAAKDRLLNWALETAPRNQDGILYHFSNGTEFWVDSLYMLPPFLACAGYYKEALRQIDGWWDALFLPEKGLLAHRWDDQTQQFIRRDVWGVGNGWAAAGMARVRALLPQEYAAQKVVLEDRIRLLLTSALRHQREDGMFHDVLDDPSSFPEINCGQMFAYTIYRGVYEGWLDSSLLNAADRIRQAAYASVDEYGLVHNVCGMPTFDHSFVAPEGQAFFILMEAAKSQLEQGGRA